MEGTIEKILFTFLWGENGKVRSCIETFKVMEMNVTIQVIETT